MDESRLIATTPAGRMQAARTLTRRELQIIEMLADGMTPKEAASELRICHGTLKNHLRAARQTLGIKTTTALVAYLLRQGIIGAVQILLIMILLVPIVLRANTSYTVNLTETHVACDCEYNLAQDVSVQQSSGKPLSVTNTASASVSLSSGKPLAETNVASDTLATVRPIGNYTASASATNTASDSLAGVRPSYAYTASLSETLSPGQSVSSVRPSTSTTESLTETNIASPAVGYLGTYLRGDTETLSPGTSVSTLGVYFRGDSEANTASASLAGQRTIPASMSESNIASPAVARTQALWRGNVIVLSFSPPSGAGGNSSYSYNIYRGTTSGGEILYATGIDAGCSSPCTYYDYLVTPGTTYYYEATTVLSGSESVVSNEAYATAQPAVLAETNTASPSTTGQSAHFGALAEINTASPSLSATHYGTATYSASMAETLSPSTSVAESHAGSCSVAETHTASDTSPATAQVLGRGPSETNATSDLLAESAAHAMSMSETNTASPSIGAQGNYSRSDAETNTAFTTVATSYNGGATLHSVLMAESLLVTDSPGYAGAYKRSDSETNTASDALGKLTAFLRGPSAETNTASDSGLTRIGTFGRIPAETNIGQAGLQLAKNGQAINKVIHRSVAATWR